jgi:hypothetical protein
MEEFGFPFTLQSNASKRFFPDNTASRFIVQLAERFSLDERWVVGLTDFHFPLSFKGNRIQNVNIKPSAYAEYTTTEGEGDGGKKRKRHASTIHDEISSPKRVKLDVAEDVTVGEEEEEEEKEGNTGGKKRKRQASAIHHAVSSPKRIKLDKLVPDRVFEGIVTPNSNDTTAIIIPPEDVQAQCRDVALGYEDALATNERECERTIERKQHKIDLCKAEKKAEIEKYEARLQELVARHQAALRDLNDALSEKTESAKYWIENFVTLAHHAYPDANQKNNDTVPKYLYVYCDIVKLRQLGDTYGNLLHIARVPPIRITGDTGEDRFSAPRYNQLERTRFDRIEFMIRDEKGRLVEFEEGTIVIISLHFKRVC